MNEREQWRFQWPDGTWIRWNPQTQSWEKEEGQDAPERAAARPEPTAVTSPPVPPTPVTPTPAETTQAATGWKRLGESQPETTVSQPVAIEPEEPATEVVAEPEPASPVSEEPQPEPIEQPSPRGPRLGVSDVIPPPRSPERPGGPLWPTIAAGAAVGIAIGLLLSNVVR